MRRRLVLPLRIELRTSPLPRGCSTTELRQRVRRAVRWRNASRNGGDPCHSGESAQARVRWPLAQRGRLREFAAHERNRPRSQNRQPEAARQARLSAAMRENLKRRKAQARAAWRRGRSRERPRGCAPDDAAAEGAAASRLSPQSGRGRDLWLTRHCPPPRGVGDGTEGANGSHTHHRRPAAQRHDPDFRREERHAAADDREPAHRGDADPRQRAAASPTSACSSSASSAITAST